MTAGTQSVLGIETLSLVASGTSNVLTTLTATEATRINVSGSASVNLGTALGTAALAGLESELLYARVDVAPGVDGAPVVMELEMIEPSLFLLQSPVALQRLVDAVVRRLG